MRRVVVAALFVAACGAGQSRLGSFSSDWQDDRGASIAALQPRIAATPVPLGADVAIGVTQAGLVGLPLAEGGANWSFAHALDARPAIAGSVVVGTGAGKVFALDAKTGKLLWERGASGVLRGAGDDGKTTVVTLGGTADANATALVVDHEGTVVRQLDGPRTLGAPAIAGPYAYFPWSGQYVSVYDWQRGEDVGRILLREQATRAFAAGGAIFFGEVGAFRLDEHIRDAAVNKATHVGLPTRELPGTPRWMTPGTEASPAAADARDRIHLYARPAAKGEATLESGKLAATYYRIAIGLDAKSGQLAWARTFASDLVAGAAYASGFAFCDVDGKISFVDAATGADAGQLAFGTKIDACVVQTDGLAKRAAIGAGPGSLVEQITLAVQPKDSEMATVQRLLLRELSSMPDEAVTKILVDLASDARTSPLLVPDVRSALASRRNGAPALLAALERHYDYLKDVRTPPPVGPIADALAGMDEKRGAAPLAAHLVDPATPSDDVRRVSAALAKLASKSELRSLETFLALYRASADDDDLVASVVNVARAIVAVGGAEGKALVAKAAADALTVPAVKTKLAGLVDAPAEDAAKPQGAK